MMKKNTKIWICITGVLLVVLGVVCICEPTATIFSMAWLIGLFTLLAGISELVFTLNTQAFLPNSGSRMLSSLLQIILGIIFLCNNFFVGLSLPMVFSIWVLVEGVMAAVRSFDYKKVGFGYWWVMLLSGIVAAVLGCLGLRYPEAAGTTLSTLVGLGIIFIGIVHFFTVAGVNRFEKKVENVRAAVKDALEN